MAYRMVDLSYEMVNLSYGIVDLCLTGWWIYGLWDGGFMTHRMADLCLTRWWIYGLQDGGLDLQDEYWSGHGFATFSTFLLTLEN